MGNLHSVQQAFNRLRTPLKLVRGPSDLKDCQALVLPGVGAFDPAMKHLQETELIPYLKEWSFENKPLLGICLGLQLLFDTSDEGVLDGLGLFNGNIQRLPKNQGERIPHMGWAPLHNEKKCPLLDTTKKTNWMYFVHSYVAMPTQKNDLAATTKYGQQFVTAIVWKNRIGACQFHPEKSGIRGQRMLARWLKWLNQGADTFS